MSIYIYVCMHIGPLVCHMKNQMWLIVKCTITKKFCGFLMSVHFMRMHLISYAEYLPFCSDLYVLNRLGWYPCWRWRNEHDNLIQSTIRPYDLRASRDRDVRTHLSATSHIVRTLRIRGRQVIFWFVLGGVIFIHLFIYLSIYLIYLFIHSYEMIRYVKHWQYFAFH